MIKNNKVINKVLLPKVLSFCFLVACSSAATVYISQEKVQQDTRGIRGDHLLTGLIALLAIVFCIDVYSDYKKGEKIAMSITRKFLKQEMENNPDLKLFDQVLYNQQAMQNLSALVFNSLRPSEKKRVVQIVMHMLHSLKNHKKYDTDNSEPLKIAREIFNDARNQIIPVIQDHASVHPEFISNIYSAMAHADMIYIMPKNLIQQHTK